MIRRAASKRELVGMIKDLDQYYPAIMPWFNRLKLDDTTPAFVYQLDGKPVGIAIGKNTQEEKKIRCVRVAERVHGLGIGTRLIDTMIEELEERYPLVTVSEELLHQYSRMFVVRYGFNLDNVEKGLYRPRKLEYLFNEG